MKARIFKTIVMSALGAITAFSAVTYSSCNNDKCKAIACAYDGVCKDGACVCKSGYEGAQCETITRDKYIGVWTVFETGTVTTSNQYNLTFKYGVGPTDMLITNFYNHISSSVSARVKGDSLFIPQQVVENYEIKGSGVLDREAFYAKHGVLTVRYTIKDLNSGLVNDFGVNIGQASTWNR